MALSSAHLEDTRTPEENFAHLLSLKTNEERHTFLASLNDKERMELYSAGYYVENSTAFSCPPSVADASKTPLEKAPHQNHVNLLYDSLFHMVSAAKTKAENAGKPLQLLVGDVHSDRTALLVASTDS